MKNVSTLCVVLILFGSIVLSSVQSTDMSALEKNTLYVAKDGSAEYVSISQALFNANPGDTIYVYPGIYDAELYINIPITLLGDDVDRTYIEPNTGGSDLITINSDNVTIENFTIRDCNLNGIYISEQSNVVLKNNIIKNHHNSGIRLLSSSNCELVGNVITQNDNGGLLTINGHDHIIMFNEFDSNALAGLWLRGTIDSYINNNKMRYNSLDGIKIESANSNNISFNSIVGNNEMGIRSDLGNGNEFYGNMISNNNLYGVTFHNSSNNLITGNSFAANLVGIWFTTCCIYNNQIYHNNFLSNLRYQAYDSSGNTTWDDGPISGGNYWSDYAGVDGNGDGFGDEAYEINGTAGSRDYYPLMERFIPFNDEVNQPPEQPFIGGPTHGEIEFDYTFNVSALDPEMHDVYFMIDWGDGEITEWLGPYPSGDMIAVTHSWDEPGNYTISVVAKDAYGKLSIESEPLTVVMDPHPQYPELIIGQILGGFGSVRVKIINNGEVDALDVNYTITTDHDYVFLGRNSSGSVDRIGPHEYVFVESDFILGFGNAMFYADAEVAGQSYDSGSQSVYVFLFYVQILISE